MRIRPAQIDDAAAIAALSARSWEATYPTILPEDLLRKMVEQQGSVDYWKSILRPLYRLRGNSVATDEAGCIIGYVTYGPEQCGNREYKGELYSLYLNPDYQGQGIGRALVTAAAGILVQEGMTSMLVWVLPGNHTARAFYEHLGGVWLCQGKFEAFDQSLETVAYGWKDLRPLAAARPHSEAAASIGTVREKVGVPSWFIRWLGRRRRT